MSLENDFSSIVRPGKVRLRFRLATEDHWISGVISTVHSRLVDVLNSDFGVILLAEEASVRSWLSAHSDAEGVNFVQINALEILIGIPIEEDRRSSSPRDPLVWVKKRPERVRIGIGPYEIVGNIYLAEGAVLEGLLAGLRYRFIPVTDAVVKRVDISSVTEEHQVVLVNRGRITFLMPATSRPGEC